MRLSIKKRFVFINEIYLFSKEKFSNIKKTW